MAGSGVNPSGVFLTGEYLGVKREPGRPRSTGEGNWPDRFKVGVRVGGDIFDVEFGSVEAAEAAVLASGVQSKGDPITLPVRARAAKGYVFWMGVGESAGSGDYE